MSYQSFEDLEVWQRSRVLVREVCLRTEAFKEWSLRDQMRRAAVSIASNIAEGAERNATAEFQHFIGIAKGSAAELRTQVYLTMDLGLIAGQEGGTWWKKPDYWEQSWRRCGAVWPGGSHLKPDT